MTVDTFAPVGTACLCLFLDCLPAFAWDVPGCELTDITIVELETSILTEYAPTQGSPADCCFTGTPVSRGRSVRALMLQPQ